MKTALPVVLATLSLVVLGCGQRATVERPGAVTLRGKPMTLVGEPVEVGQPAPDFVAVAQDMSEKRLSDFSGRHVVLSVVPSVDTKVCATQTRAFNQKAAALGDDVVILTISMDLPMAQQRFCAAEGIDRVVMLSDFRYWDFAEKYGQRIKENGLLARAIYVIDPDGTVVYKQLVPELTDEPDYEAALRVLKAGAPATKSALTGAFAKMVPEDAAQRGPNGMRQARDVFHKLLSEHKLIKRTVEDIPGGVRTVTTSEDPQIAALIQLHVRQMVSRFEAGMPVRKWDPVFAELHKHYNKVELKMEDVPGGLRVVETSDDPRVVLLIRQHAHRGVSEFVERGFDRAHQATPLPEGYER